MESFIKIVSTKIILLHNFFLIKLLLSNYLFFHYCDSNILILSISKIITLNLCLILVPISSLLLFLYQFFASFFCISSLLLFFIAHSTVIALPIIAIPIEAKAINKERKSKKSRQKKP